jgi:hypothetical protein
MIKSKNNNLIAILLLFVFFSIQFPLVNIEKVERYFNEEQILVDLRENMFANSFYFAATFKCDFGKYPSFHYFHKFVNRSLLVFNRTSLTLQKISAETLFSQSKIPVYIFVRILRI